VIKNFKVGNEPPVYPEAWGSMPTFEAYARTKYDEIENYMATTGAEADLPPLSHIIERVRTERDARWAKWSDPKAVERRERAAARKAAIQALGIGD
jgi:hypothetical protein